MLKMLTGHNAQRWSMAQLKRKFDKICEFLLELNRFQKYCLFRRTKRKKKVETRSRLELTSHTYEGEGNPRKGSQVTIFVTKYSRISNVLFEAKCIQSRHKVVVAYIFSVQYYLILSLLFTIYIAKFVLVFEIWHQNHTIASYQILVPKHK